MFVTLKMTRKKEPEKIIQSKHKKNNTILKKLTIQRFNKIIQANLITNLQSWKRKIMKVHKKRPKKIKK